MVALEDGQFLMSEVSLCTRTKDLALETECFQWLIRTSTLNHVLAVLGVSW